MKLFRGNTLFQPQPVITPSSLQLDPAIHTPLGTIRLGLSLSDHPLVLTHSHNLKNEGRIYTYNNQSLECELFIVQINPELPEHLRVEECWGAVFRIRPQTDETIHQCTFSAHWTQDYSWNDCGWDTGENLEALQYRNQEYQLHLGTQDRDMLQFRRDQQDQIPQTFAINDTIWGSDRGLSVPMTLIQADEICQIHFVIAWNKQLPDDISTWLAVDQQTAAILQASNLF